MRKRRNYRDPCKNDKICIFVTVRILKNKNRYRKLDFNTYKLAFVCLGYWELRHFLIYHIEEQIAHVKAWTFCICGKGSRRPP